MLSLNIFLSEFEILLNHLARKLTHFMTPNNIKEEIIRFCKESIKSEVFFEYFMVLDIDPQRKDVIKEIIEALSKIYVGVKPPEGLVVPP